LFKFYIFQTTKLNMFHHLWSRILAHKSRAWTKLLVYSIHESILSHNTTITNDNSVNKGVKYLTMNQNGITLPSIGLEVNSVGNKSQKPPTWLVMWIFLNLIWSNFDISLMTRNVKVMCNYFINMLYSDQAMQEKHCLAINLSIQFKKFKCYSCQWWRDPFGCSQ
jgi:hypothetical protein